MLSHVKPGDAIAIMPSRHSPPSDVLEIAQAAYVGEVALVLSNAKVYSVKDGSGLAPESTGYVCPATDEHRAALRKRPG